MNPEADKNNQATFETVMFLVVTAQAAIFSFLILQTYNSFPLASTHFFLPTSKPTREKSIWKDLGKISCSTSNISNHLTIIFNIVLNVSLRLSRLVWILGPFFQGSFPLKLLLDLMSEHQHFYPFTFLLTLLLS